MGIVKDIEREICSHRSYRTRNGKGDSYTSRSGKRGCLGFPASQSCLVIDSYCLNQNYKPNLWPWSYNMCLQRAILSSNNVVSNLSFILNPFILKPDDFIIYPLLLDR